MHVRILLLPFSAVTAVVADVGFDDASDTSVLLLQTAMRPPAMEWVEHTMGQMEELWTTGNWATPWSGPQECGKATFKELQVTIPKWRQSHAGVDGFCHFENYAWFRGAGSANYYGEAVGLHVANKEAIPFCDTAGELSTDGAPSLEFKYDGGRFVWTHVRNCADVVDDPYCYSLGWLKGQGYWDEALLKNATAWQQLARRECNRLQEEFYFDDEEVTVGRHSMGTPLYFKRTLNSLRGRGMPVDRRLHAEHVYTKCQLGGDHAAAHEMAYCFFKGCVLPGDRVGHYDECDYK